MSEQLPSPPDQISIEAIWSPPFKELPVAPELLVTPQKVHSHQEHQQMLQDHKHAKQERRERHHRTHGKVKPYCGNIY